MDWTATPPAMEATQPPRQLLAVQNPFTNRAPHARERATQLKVRSTATRGPNRQKLLYMAARWYESVQGQKLCLLPESKIGISHTASRHRRRRRTAARYLASEVISL